MTYQVENIYLERVSAGTLLLCSWPKLYIPKDQKHLPHQLATELDLQDQMHNWKNDEIIWSAHSIWYGTPNISLDGSDHFLLKLQLHNLREILTIFSLFFLVKKKKNLNRPIYTTCHKNKMKERTKELLHHNPYNKSIHDK